VDSIDVFGEIHRTHVFPAAVPALFSEALAHKELAVVVLAAPAPSPLAPLVAPLLMALLEMTLVIFVGSLFGMLPMMILGAIMVFDGAATGAGIVFDAVVESGRRKTLRGRVAALTDLVSEPAPRPRPEPRDQPPPPQNLKTARRELETQPVHAEDDEGNRQRSE